MKLNLSKAKKVKDSNELKEEWLNNSIEFSVEGEKIPGWNVWYDIEIYTYKTKFKSKKTNEYKWEEKEVVNFLQNMHKVSKTICREMKLYHDGVSYIYTNRNGEYKTVSKSQKNLQEIVTAFYFELRQEEKWWRNLVNSHILPFVEEVRINREYIIFANGAIDMKESFIKKEVVWLEGGGGIVDIEGYPTRFKNHNLYINKLPNKVKAHKALFDTILANLTDLIESDEAKQRWYERIAVSIALIMLPINKYGTINVWKSEPGAGKNVLLNPIVELFGTNAYRFNVHNRLQDDNFHLAGGYKKKLFYTDETKANQEWHMASELQTAASNGTLSIRKHGSSNFNWDSPDLNMLFLTNHAILASQEAGIWRRLNIIEFTNNIITKREKYYIDNVLERVRDKSFVEYFVHKVFLDGFNILLEKGFKFDLESQIKAKNESLEKPSFGLEDFLNEYQFGNLYTYFLDNKPTTMYIEYPNKNSLFKTFLKWWSDTSLENNPVKNLREFTEEIDKYISVHMPGSEIKVRRIDGKPKKTYRFEKQEEAIEEENNLEEELFEGIL